MLQHKQQSVMQTFSAGFFAVAMFLMIVLLAADNDNPERRIWWFSGTALCYHQLLHVYYVLLTFAVVVWPHVYASQLSHTARAQCDSNSS
jgi:hypothetical protein